MRASLRCAVLLVAVLAVVSCASVSVVGKKTEEKIRHSLVWHEPHVHHGNHTGSATMRHPTVLSRETLALYAKINADLEARNYTAPNGARGVDVSQWAGQATWTCLKKAGYTFAIVRGYCSVCAVDPNGVHTVANAWAAGIAHVDIYMFPSFSCGTSAAGQVDAAINNMGSIPFGQIWFDIESGGGSSGASQAHGWLTAGVNRAVARLGSKRVGIYSSKYMWSVVMGSLSGFSSFPLWYAHYDNSASFSDFSGFAGWTRPAMKQYIGDATVCGMGVDVNCY